MDVLSISSDQWTKPSGAHRHAGTHACTHWDTEALLMNIPTLSEEQTLFVFFLAVSPTSAVNTSPVKILRDKPNKPKYVHKLWWVDG